MKFLIDQPLSPLLAEWLRGEGHDAYHARERNLSRSADEHIFGIAAEEGRIVVTSDLDFSRILALSGNSRPGLILFRAGNITDVQMLELLRKILSQVDGPQLFNSVVVADRDTMRIASLPILRRT
ncbi:MAG: DUF5615 family PIN-like protein [Planctomycetota bacterium]